MRAAARPPFSISFVTALVLAVSAAALFLVATPSPAWSQWSGAGSTQATPVIVRGDTWYLRNSNTAGAADISFTYGNPGDIPVMGDWNGDGTDTPGVVRGNMWYLRNSNATGTADISFAYGDPGDRPVTGDWNGDGTDTPGVVRGNMWYLRNSNATGTADISFAYGDPGDRPVTGDWNGDGTDTPGVVRGNRWYLRNSNATGTADISFAYGNPGDKLLGERVDRVAEPEDPLQRGDEGPAVAHLQDGLERLGFWVGPKDGIFGGLTEQAVYAVQKYEGLPITGVADSATRQRIESGPPVQAATTVGDIIEIDKFRQVVFIVRNGRTVWAFNTSTGNEEPYVYDGQQYDAVTPTGRFEVFREVDGWEESHLGELYRSKYFTYNGIALHGSTFVPPYAASHGCVRLTIDAMDYIWQQDLAPIGIDVWVYGSLPG